MFHVELRQFPHNARVFNLTEAELREQIVTPWVAGVPVAWGEREWSPQKAKLTIISGAQLPPGALGMGRGWAEAVRDGKDVTEALLSEARQVLGERREALGALKRELTVRCAERPHLPTEVVALAEERWPHLRVSERLALAEQAVWELLHEHRLRLLAQGAAGEELPHGQWQPQLLSWAVWSGTAVPAIRLSHHVGDEPGAFGA